jgi:phosphoenolpyruvate synthase/pyruvate phosphate dikinase
MADESEILSDTTHENRDDCFMDGDRMINEGLGGGIVTPDNGLIEKTTTDTMAGEESVKDEMQ